MVTLEFTGTPGAAIHGTLVLADGTHLDFADTLPQTLTFRGTVRVDFSKDRKEDTLAVTATRNGTHVATSSGAGNSRDFTFNNEESSSGSSFGFK